MKTRFGEIKTSSQSVDIFLSKQRECEQWAHAGWSISYTCVELLALTRTPTLLWKIKVRIYFPHIILLDIIMKKIITNKIKDKTNKLKVFPVSTDWQAGANFASWVRSLNVNSTIPLWARNHVKIQIAPLLKIIC